MITVERSREGMVSCNSCDAATYVRYGQQPTVEALFEVAVQAPGSPCRSITLLCADCLRDLSYAAYPHRSGTAVAK
jgi:hypothetical protein